MDRLAHRIGIPDTMANGSGRGQLGPRAAAAWRQRRQRSAICISGLGRTSEASMCGDWAVVRVFGVSVGGGSLPMEEAVGGMAFDYGVHIICQ